MRDAVASQETLAKELFTLWDRMRYVERSYGETLAVALTMAELALELVVRWVFGDAVAAAMYDTVWQWEAYVFDDTQLGAIGGGGLQWNTHWGARTDLWEASQALRQWLNEAILQVYGPQ